MGQVPHPSYGIVGDGRLARHMAHYLRSLEIPFQQWSRKQSRISAHDALRDSDVILVMITDSAIESWIDGSGLDGKRFVHFSGALMSDRAAGVHPLMTFGPELYEKSDYEKIPFVCEKSGPGFHEIFPGLSNPHYVIEAKDKALYHALCVMSGNFTVLLWQKLFEDLEKKLGIPSKAALPYLERVAANLKKNPASAATGPIARGDRETIRKNLEALEGDPFQKIYQAFNDAFLGVQ